MRRKLLLFMHVSLDGFVAGPKGEMEWINVDDEIFEHVGDRTNQADTALYGRVTYDMMESYWPTAADQPGASKHDIEHSRWYNKVAKVVVSKTLQNKNLPNVKVIGENLKLEVDQLKQSPGKDIIIFGSPGAAHSLMHEGLIDEYWLFVNPVLIGQGIPLFKVKELTKLKLISSKIFSSGVISLHYQVNK